MNNLESDREELAHILAEVHSTLDPLSMLKSRASELYSTVKTLPMSRAMHTLKLDHMEKPVETIINRTEVNSEPIEHVGNKNSDDETSPNPVG